jgi:hypothetical protein
MITLLWNTAEVDNSEYTTVDLCTNDGTPLQNMRVNSSYVFNCPAYVPQNFKIICMMSGNNPPIANPDNYTTNQDAILSVIAPGVLGNDYDPDADPLTAVKVADPSHGTLIFRSNGSFIYTPALHYFGSDFFTYKAYDGTAYSDNATVSLTVNPIHYTLAITCQGSGTVMKNPDQSWYTYGQVVNLSANPSTGWVFNHWGGDLTGNTNPTTITINGNKSVIANFTITSGYTLTIAIQGLGTVTKVPDLPSYTYGQVVTLTAIPSTGWVFNHWAGDLSGNTNPTTITMNGNKSVIANFTALHYTLTITIQGAGSVTKNPDQPWYRYGTVVTLNAVSTSHWVFHHWAGDLTGNANPTTITMNGNKSVIANFTFKNQPPLTPNKPSGETKGKVGTTYWYTAVTTDGEGDQLWYQFNWGDGTTSTWRGPYNSGITANASHAWTKRGSYGIKVKAKDSYGAESNWSSTLPITMPLSAHYYRMDGLVALVHLILRFLRGGYPGMTLIQVLKMEGWFR